MISIGDNYLILPLVFDIPHDYNVEEIRFIHR